MATYVTLVNRVLESLNEITLATNGTDFTSSRGIQSAVKTFVNLQITFLLMQTGLIQIVLLVVGF